jgi:uncharacterized protein YmfQ (DUF2313 family)
MSQNHKNVIKQLFPVELGEKHDLDMAIEGDHLDDVQSSGETLLANIYPDTAFELLSDWERLLGLSPDETASVEERVTACVAKFKVLGGLSIPYFTQLAAAMGCTIEIVEPQPFMAGISAAGDTIYDPYIIFCWRVEVENAANIEDLFQDLKPAHTYVYFRHPYYEDFTTHIEQDVNSHITVEEQAITFENLDWNEDAWVRKDFGIDFFSGNFTHQVIVKATGSIPTTGNPLAAIWTISNIVDDILGIESASGDYLSILMYYDLAGTTPSLALRECDSGTYYQSTYAIEEGVEYYLTVHRDESIGTFGTLYCYVYSDPERTLLITTLSLALHTSKKNFRHLLALNSYNAGYSPIPISGVVSNLQIVT